MNLDFTNCADRRAEQCRRAGAGDAVDSSGNALTTLRSRFELPDSEPVRIEPGIPATVTLDFDLDASNTVDFTTNPAKVTVQPIPVGHSGIRAGPRSSCARIAAVGRSQREYRDAEGAAVPSADRRVRPFDVCDRRSDAFRSERHDARRHRGSECARPSRRGYAGRCERHRDGAHVDGATPCSRARACRGRTATSSAAS